MAHRPRAVPRALSREKTRNCLQSSSVQSSRATIQDGGMNRGTAVIKTIKSYLRNIGLVAVRSPRLMMELFEGLRKRKGGVNRVRDKKKGEDITRNEKNLEDAAATSPPEIVQPGTYWLTRIVFLRSLGFIYCKLLKHYFCNPFIIFLQVFL